MTSHGWLQIGLTLLIGLLISIPVGRYLARVVTDRKTPLDRLLDPIDNFIYLLIGRRICGQPMDWKAYTLHMLATNFVMALIIFLILVFQDYLPLNPRHFAGMEPMLAFNTAVSFITNTDWQAFGGETTLSNFSQMTAITFPMFTSATTGFVVAMAFIRAFSGIITCFETCQFTWMAVTPVGEGCNLLSILRRRRAPGSAGCT